MDLRIELMHEKKKQSINKTDSIKRKQMEDEISECTFKPDVNNYYSPKPTAPLHCKPVFVLIPT